MVTTTQVNAYYSQYTNSIKIPIWVLEGLFFHYDRPKYQSMVFRDQIIVMSRYLNYGSLGWIIGHELIHPFDNIGGRFDKRGNLRDWWDVETRTRFDNKSNCFVKQYPKYLLNDVIITNFDDIERINYLLSKIKVKSRLSENMADNGGIDIAFRVFFRLL